MINWNIEFNIGIHLTILPKIFLLPFSRDCSSFSNEFKCDDIVTIMVEPNQLFFIEIWYGSVKSVSDTQIAWILLWRTDFIEVMSVMHRVWNPFLRKSRKSNVGLYFYECCCWFGMLTRSKLICNKRNTELRKINIDFIRFYIDSPFGPWHHQIISCCGITKSHPRFKFFILNFINPFATSISLWTVEKLTHMCASSGTKGLIGIWLVNQLCIIIEIIIIS